MHDLIYIFLGVIFVLFIAWAITFGQDRYNDKVMDKYLDRIRKFDFKDREDDRIFVLEYEIKELFNKISQLQAKFNSEKSEHKRLELARKINNFYSELEHLQKRRHEVVNLKAYYVFKMGVSLFPVNVVEANSHPESLGLKYNQVVDNVKCYRVAVEAENEELAKNLGEALIDEKIKTERESKE